LYFWRKTPEMTNNEIPIEQINKLDAAAFRLLYKNYYKALVCYAITIVGDSESAEDILHYLGEKDVFPVSGFIQGLSV
jgi:hypothetical protein